MKVYLADTMINGELKGKLFLESDALQFIIKEYNGAVDKEGREIGKAVGYFTNIQYALKHLFKMKVMESSAVTLQELRRDIESIREYIEQSFDIERIGGLVGGQNNVQ